MLLQFVKDTDAQGITSGALRAALHQDTGLSKWKRNVRHSFRLRSKRVPVTYRLLTEVVVPVSVSNR